MYGVLWSCLCASIFPYLFLFVLKKQIQTKYLAFGFRQHLIKLTNSELKHIYSFLLMSYLKYLAFSSIPERSLVGEDFSQRNRWCTSNTYWYKKKLCFFSLIRNSFPDQKSHFIQLSEFPVPLSRACCWNVFKKQQLLKHFRGWGTSSWNGSKP